MAIGKIGTGALLKQDDTVRADAEAVAAEAAEKERIAIGRPDAGAVIDQDEIVAGRRYFDKVQFQFMSPIMDCFL
jgi:hypothetical protein